MKFHDCAPPYENSWLYMEKSIFQCPCTQYVWLIVGDWWTILLWSGSTKGWGRAGSAILLICNEVLVWLTHQKLDYPEIFWCNFRNWGGHFPLLATRLLHHMRLPLCRINKAHKWNAFLCQNFQMNQLSTRQLSQTKTQCYLKQFVDFIYI